MKGMCSAGMIRYRRTRNVRGLTFVKTNSSRDSKELLFSLHTQYAYNCVAVKHPLKRFISELGITVQCLQNSCLLLSFKDLFDSQMNGFSPTGCIVENVDPFLS